MRFTSRTNGIELISNEDHDMNRVRKVSGGPWALLALGIAALAASAVVNAVEQPDAAVTTDRVLLTEAEGARYSYAGETWDVVYADAERTGRAGRTKSLGQGPSISLIKPTLVKEGKRDVARTSTPLDLNIVIKETLAALDVRSLRVSVAKGIWPSKDLTERVRPYFKDGVLKLDRFEAPAGIYRLRLDIADVEKRKTSVEWVLEVVAGGRR